MNPAIVLMVLLTSLSLGAHAEQWQPLSGIYAVTAENYLDPAPDEPGNSHFRLQLTGSSARDLYLAIPGDAAFDECTGGQFKASGEVRCVYYVEDELYECAFSINLLEHRLEYGIAC